MTRPRLPRIRPEASAITSAPLAKVRGYVGSIPRGGRHQARDSSAAFDLKSQNAACAAGTARGGTSSCPVSNCRLLWHRVAGTFKHSAAWVKRRALGRNTGPKLVFSEAGASCRAVQGAGRERVSAGRRGGHSCAAPLRTRAHPRRRRGRRLGAGHPGAGAAFGASVSRRGYTQLALYDLNQSQSQSAAIAVASAGVDADGRQRRRRDGGPGGGRARYRARAGDPVEEQRSALLLVVLEGLSYREVAEIQAVPIGTVMSRLARARAQVKAFLDGERPMLRRVK